MSCVLRVTLVAVVLALALAPGRCPAREIHVATNGNDSSSGSQDNPYKTIGKAASLAQPGDIVTVHAGTYREWVKPARGGTDEDLSLIHI